MIEDMTEKFGNQILGVHGAELPKFAGHNSDQFYWTMQKSYKRSPRCQSLNMLQQTNKFWAKNDSVRIADTTGLEAPVDPLKTTYLPKKSKFHVSNKVANENHWAPTDKTGDAELKKGWMPLLKWSEKDRGYKCEGADRQFRTFAKIVDHAQQYDKMDDERDKKREEVIIKQAPRSLQVELAQKIQNEKLAEEKMRIGFNSVNREKGSNQMKRMDKNSNPASPDNAMKT